MSKEYTVDSIPVNTNGQSVDANCADIMFVNYGTTDLIVNHSIRIPAPAVGQFNAMQISGNVGEIDRTKYTCFFRGAAAPGGNDALIIRRNYK